MMMGPGAVSPISVYIVGPGSHIIGNGTSVVGQSTIAAIVNGGLAPITYSWSKAGAQLNNVFLSASNSTNLRYLATGTDTSHVGTLQVIATDAGGYAITASAAFEVTQGTPP